MSGQGCLWQVNWKLVSADALCSVCRTERVLHPSSLVTRLPPAVHLFLLIPGDANKSVSSSVSRYGLWPRAGWGSAHTPSRLKTGSGPLLSAHYSGKGDMLGFCCTQECFHFIRSDKLEKFPLVCLFQVAMNHSPGELNILQRLEV